MKFVVKRGGQRRILVAQFLICERERLFSAINNLRGINARSSVKDGDPIFVKKKRGLVNGRYIYILI